MADASFEFLSDTNEVHYGSNTWQKSLEENEKQSAQKSSIRLWEYKETWFLDEDN